jgi:adenosylcobyric acid synthase
MESRSGKPVLGVIPHFDHIAIPEEDSVALERRMRGRSDSNRDEKVSIGVVRLPFISNYTDFDVFEQDAGVHLEYFDRPELVFQFDAVILPGSKNTLEDLEHLDRSGIADAVVAFAKSGGTVVGICGGYQMLGLRVTDPHGMESRLRETAGLRLLEMETEMAPDKITSQVEATVEPKCKFFRDAAKLHGYEIHMGRSTPIGDAFPLFHIVTRDGREADFSDGLIRSNGRVWGTYIHGIFDNDGFREGFLQDLRQTVGKTVSADQPEFSFRSWKDSQYDLLAEHVRLHVDIDTIYRAIGLR